MIISKEAIGLLSVLVSLTATVHYVYLIAKNRAKPHMFTWIIWTIVITISAAGRMVAEAGPGAWAAWAGGGSCLVIAVLSFFKGERNISKLDTVFFVMALAAIPLWLLTDSPLAAVILVSAIDFLAFLPTIRKSYVNPFEEPVYNYLVSLTMQALSLAANEVHSWTTSLTPLTVVIGTLLLLGVILGRRKSLKILVS